MATIFSAALKADCSTDVNFRGWTQFIEDTLVSTGGWVVTSDTGQTVPSTLVHPTGSLVKVGYRIYTMNDALQATTPVFMRIDYGCASSNAIPAIWPTIGTGSNGSGTITGITWNGGALATAPIGSTGGTVAANNSYGSAGTSRFSLGMFIQASVPPMLVFTLERTKNSLGADSDDGLLLIYRTTVTNTSIDVTRYLRSDPGPQPTAEQGLTYILSIQNPSETLGGSIGVGIVTHFCGVAQQPGTNFMITNTNDVSAEGSITLPLYGSTRTYQQLNLLPVAKTLSANSSVDSSARCLMRYD